LTAIRPGRSVVGRGCSRINAPQNHVDSRPGTGTALDPGRPAAAARNSEHLAEPEPGPFAGLLGRVEGLEGARRDLRGHSGPRVGNGYPDVVAGLQFGGSEERRVGKERRSGGWRSV